MTLELDRLDHLSAKAFEGFVVRKDLVRRYAKAYPVPAYVVEFLLGRYCASTDEAEIKEGLEIVEKQLKDRCVRTGQEEVFKNEAYRKGSVRIIDTIRARLDAKNACYIAELPSLALRDVRIPDSLVEENERILIDGFYAEVTLAYDSIIAQEKNGRPFGIEALRPIQMSRADVLDTFLKGALDLRHRTTGSIFCYVPSASSPPSSTSGRRELRSFAWFLSSSATTILWSSDRAERARATCFNRFRLTRT